MVKKLLSEQGWTLDKVTDTEAVTEKQALDAKTITSPKPTRKYCLFPDCLRTQLHQQYLLHNMQVRSKDIVSCHADNA